MKDSSAALSEVVERRSFLTAGLVCTASSCMGAGKAHATAPRGAVGRPLPELEAELDRRLKVDRVPGASFAIVRHGETVWATGLGLADVDRKLPMSVDHHWALASVTKTMIATVILRVLDDGMISLDRDVSHYLPYTVRHPMFPDRPITIRMILTHTSGMAGDEPDPYRASYTAGELTERWQDVGESWFSTKSWYYGPSSPFFSRLAPGDRADYSNVGFILLSHIVEVVTGRSFFDVIREKLFAPLRMKSAGIRHADLDPKTAGRQYGLWTADKAIGSFSSEMRHLLDVPKRTATKAVLNGAIPFAPYNFPCFADGAVRCSVLDLARFVAIWAEGGHLDGRQILPPPLVAKALQGQVAADRLPSNAAAIGLRQQGIGFRQYEINPGDTAWGHNGGDIGTSTSIRFDQSRHTGIAVMLNRDVDDVAAYAKVLWGAATAISA